MSISTNSGEAIFIYLSKACRCTRRKCNVMESKLHNVMTNQKYSKVKLTKIDYSTNPKDANKILDKYKLGPIPVVVILDPNGEKIYEEFYGLTSLKFTESLDTIFKKK